MAYPSAELRRPFNGLGCGPSACFLRASARADDLLLLLANSEQNGNKNVKPAIDQLGICSYLYLRKFGKMCDSSRQAGADKSEEFKRELVRGLVE